MNGLIDKWWIDGEIDIKINIKNFVCRNDINLVVILVIFVFKSLIVM